VFVITPKVDATRAEEAAEEVLPGLQVGFKGFPGLCVPLADAAAEGAEVEVIPAGNADVGFVFFAEGPEGF
jgi:Na+-translocating ferredoxin:NAD+ oxidoreductase RNF subunit RnfB